MANIYHSAQKLDLSDTYDGNEESDAVMEEDM
jgi:hypothetical protein